MWQADNSWQVPVHLETFLSVIKHYNLRLDDDIPLVQTLFGWTAGTHITYYKQHGLSDAAKGGFDRLLADPSLHAGAVHHLLGFLEGTDYISESALESLISTTNSDQRPDELRLRSLRILIMKGATNEQLLEIAQRNGPPVADEVLNALVGRQHRPTIERRLAALLESDAAIRAGEVEFPEDSAFGWFLKIRTPEVWNRLAALRLRALELQLPHVVDQVTQVLARIDMRRLARLIREQVRVAPRDWQDIQRIRAMEYERDARLLAAQKTDFDAVIRKLTGNTTMKIFKIWCEGPTDSPFFVEFGKKLSSLATTRIVSQDLGGWTNATHRGRDLSRLRDGCQDLMVILDGDRGRVMQDPHRPLTERAIDFRERLLMVDIELRVLWRYGIENYFSQSATGAVLGRDLSAYFPLPEVRPIDEHLPNLSKALNGAIARLMTLDDIEGTDLADILGDIHNRCRL